MARTDRIGEIGGGAAKGFGVGRAIGRAVVKTAVKAAEKSAEKEAVVKLANTKPVRAATKAVAKQVAKRDVVKTKRAVNAVADMQQKTKAEQIAKNSVKVVSADKAGRASKNLASTVKTMNAKSGLSAERGAASVKTSKPKATIKINSAPKKKG